MTNEPGKWLTLEEIKRQLNKMPPVQQKQPDSDAPNASPGTGAQNYSPPPYDSGKQNTGTQSLDLVDRLLDGGRIGNDASDRLYRVMLDSMKSKKGDPILFAKAYLALSGSTQLWENPLLIGAALMMSLGSIGSYATTEEREAHQRARERIMPYSEFAKSSRQLIGVMKRNEQPVSHGFKVMHGLEEAIEREDQESFNQLWRSEPAAAQITELITTRYKCDMVTGGDANASMGYIIRLERMKGEQISAAIRDGTFFRRG